jgi:adenosylhomocysteine nucleosidase
MTGIVIATMLEAKSLIDGMALSVLEEKPFRVFGNAEYLLIISGIGKVNAGVATGYLAAKFGVPVFLNVGAAGALSEQCNFGDIYHIVDVIEPDSEMVLLKTARTAKADMLKGFAMATLATQDVPVINPETRKRLSALADLADMEGAAVLQAAKKFGARCYLFKIVSDTAEHCDDRRIVENIKMLGTALRDFVIEKILKTLPETGEKIAIDDAGKRC